jgi:hypothetical protein
LQKLSALDCLGELDRKLADLCAKIMSSFITCILNESKPDLKAKPILVQLPSNDEKDEKKSVLNLDFAHARAE